MTSSVSPGRDLDLQGQREIFLHLEFFALLAPWFPPANHKSDRLPKVCPRNRIPPGVRQLRVTRPRDKLECVNELLIFHCIRRSILPHPSYKHKLLIFNSLRRSSCRSPAPHGIQSALCRWESVSIRAGGGGDKLDSRIQSAAGRHGLALSELLFSGHEPWLSLPQLSARKGQAHFWPNPEC